MLTDVPAEENCDNTSCDTICSAVAFSAEGVFELGVLPGFGFKVVSVKVSETVDESGSDIPNVDSHTGRVEMGKTVDG